MTTKYILPISLVVLSISSICTSGCAKGIPSGQNNTSSTVQENKIPDMVSDNATTSNKETDNESAKAGENKTIQENRNPQDKASDDITEDTSQPGLIPLDISQDNLSDFDLDAYKELYRNIPENLILSSTSYKNGHTYTTDIILGGPGLETPYSYFSQKDENLDGYEEYIEDNIIYAVFKQADNSEYCKASIPDGYNDFSFIEEIEPDDYTIYGTTEINGVKYVIFEAINSSYMDEDYGAEVPEARCYYFFNEYDNLDYLTYNIREAKNLQDLTSVRIVPIEKPIDVNGFDFKEMDYFDLVDKISEKAILY